MRTAIAYIEGTSPYSQSRLHETEKLPEEDNDAYERRTWRNKAHVLPNGNIFIPPIAFKQALDFTVKSLGRQIPGKGKATFTKFFLSGVSCTQPVDTSIKAADMRCEKVHCNPQGIRGGGKRVWKYFPVIDTWSVKVPFLITSDHVTNEIFEEHLPISGSLAGVGRYRPQNGGYFGRYIVKKIEWQT
jgi:hypothetical protein